MEFLQEAYTDSETEDIEDMHKDGVSTSCSLSYNDIAKKGVDYLGLNSQTEIPTGTDDAIITEDTDMSDSKETDMNGTVASLKRETNPESNITKTMQDSVKLNLGNGMETECTDTEVLTHEKINSCISIPESKPEGCTENQDCTSVTENETKSDQRTEVDQTVDILMYRDKNGQANKANDSSDSDSSSSVSSVEIGNALLGDVSSSDDEGQAKNKDKQKKAGGKLKTKGELHLEDLPQIEDLQISVADDVVLEELGAVSAIVDTLVIIQSTPNLPALDDDSILFLEGRKAMGQVFETFGPVSAPFYSVRFNSPQHMEEKGITVGGKVYYAPEMSTYTRYVFLTQLQQLKGSDASWEHNNEPPQRFIDYSDDEDERRAKAKRRGKATADKAAPDTKTDDTDCLPTGTRGKRFKQKNRENVNKGGDNRNQQNDSDRPGTDEFSSESGSRPRWAHPPRPFHGGQETIKQWPPVNNDHGNRGVDTRQISHNQDNGQNFTFSGGLNHHRPNMPFRFPDRDDDGRGGPFSGGERGEGGSWLQGPPPSSNTDNYQMREGPNNRHFQGSFNPGPFMGTPPPPTGGNSQMNGPGAFPNGPRQMGTGTGNEFQNNPFSNNSQNGTLGGFNEVNTGMFQGARDGFENHANRHMGRDSDTFQNNTQNIFPGNNQGNMFSTNSYPDRPPGNPTFRSGNRMPTRPNNQWGAMQQPRFGGGPFFPQGSHPPWP